MNKFNKKYKKKRNLKIKYKVIQYYKIIEYFNMIIFYIHLGNSNNIIFRQQKLNIIKKSEKELTVPYFNDFECY